MILADTSVWVEHVRHADAVLQAMLEAGQVLTHPFIIGEVALGHMRSRQAVLTGLHALPSAVSADNEEVFDLIEKIVLYGTGIGYVEAHLLASARLTHALLWTRDKRLLAAAARLGLAYRPH